MEGKTITAISTPHGRGGIAVVRLSGPDAFAIAHRVWKGASLRDAASHTAHLCTLIDPSDQAPIDQVVATIFRGPNSFTGEDTIEFACHGAPYIQQQIVRALIAAGAAPAGPGEFTQRAFLNGRLDLAQAEGVADLIAASSAASHRLALRQATGQFSKAISRLHDSLLHFAAMLELELDFSEEDVEFASRRHLLQLAVDARAQIAALADSFRAGRIFKHGLPIVIAGIPNAGKSTLLNALVGDDKAITSHIPGTTRDIIEASAIIGDIECRFIDTAGIRQSTDPIELLGIQRAQKAIADAAIILWLTDPTVDVLPQIDTMRQRIAGVPADVLLIPLITKADLLAPSFESAAPLASLPDIAGNVEAALSDANIQHLSPILISALNPTLAHGLDSCGNATSGLDALRDAITGYALRDANPATDLIVTNERHYQSLCAARDDLDRVLASLRTLLPSPASGSGAPSPSSPAPSVPSCLSKPCSSTTSAPSSEPSCQSKPCSSTASAPSSHPNADTYVSTDLIAEDLRQVLSHLSEITGAITTPPHLSHLFSSFCIGK